MDYLAWNNAIGRRFFNSDRSNARVFLYVTTDVITEIGAPHDADLSNFKAAVKSGPPWNTRHGRGICQQALQAFEDWRDRNLEYPPYLSYLALFVLADTVDVVGFARHAYYPGLRFLLDEEPVTGMYPSFQHMHCLWDDLAVWANQDRHGDYGIFDADIVGEWMHVGVPRAQTLLTDEERRNLPFLFADNGLDPHSPPSEQELTYLLAHDQQRHLRHHTKELLNSRNEGDSAIRTALVEAILDELENWDGTVSAVTHAAGQTRSSFGSLLVAMAIDSTARTAHLSLRCRSKREYPAEGLRFIGEGMREPLYCYEGWLGWSTALSTTESSIDTFDPSDLDWRNGLSLTDYEHSWRTSLSKRTVRIMVSAKPFGFDGFVEESQIPHCRPFYMLAHDDHTETLKAWGNEGCTGFYEVNLISGLPNGWRIYFVDCATSDTLIRDAFPFLAFPTVVRIQFRGGLKVRGNQYFIFALPQIEITGLVENVSVFCNDHQLIIDLDTGMYVIPNTLCARRFIIEVRRNGECIRRRSLYTLETVAWRDVVSEVHLDKFGRWADAATAETCVGPIVNGITLPEFDSATFLPPGEGRCVYFVGRNPGEIVECPHETIPDNWQPVWAIPMQKRGKGTVVYCGKDPAKETPETATCKDPKKRRLWKKVLWNKRKKIAEPSHPVLRSLWRRYKEVASCVR